MQIVGVAPVGARSLRGVAVAALEPRPIPAYAVPRDAATFEQQARIAVETVVLPRQGSEIDHRNDQLRRREAQEAYRRDGEAAEAPNARASPNSPHRRF